jgi:peptide deformylase
MKLLELHTYPEPVLAKAARQITEAEFNGDPLPEYGKSLNSMLEEMATLLYKTQSGIGLAAPQVGIPVQVALVDVNRKSMPLVLVNPTITKLELTEQQYQDGDRVFEEAAKEGCLSVPGVLLNVKRYNKIHVVAQNNEGKKIEFNASGLLARAIQHEVDHLSGKLIIHRGNLLGNPKVNKILSYLQAKHEHHLKLVDKREAKKKEAKNETSPV